jgi:hypothetical protein
MRTLTFVGLLSLLIVAAVGCAAPEERIVDYFLGAVRDGNVDVVAGVSLVNFPDADIESWEVVEIGPESTEPYQLPEVRAALYDAKQAYEAKTEENDGFLRSNEKNALRYQQKMKEDPDYKFTRGAMADFQEVWQEMVEEQKELQNKIKEAEKALERERNSIRMSASIPLKESFQGDVAIKRVKVNVAGGSGTKTYSLTLRKYNIVDSDTGLSPISKWIVTNIEEG